MRVQKQVPEFARLNIPDAKKMDIDKHFKHRLNQPGGLQAANLLSQLLVYDSSKRLSVDQALSHSFFTDFQTSQEEENSLNKQIIDLINGN